MCWIVYLFLLLPGIVQADAAAPPRKIILLSRQEEPWPGRPRLRADHAAFKVMLDNSNVAEHVRVEVHENGWPADEKTLDDADAIVFYSDGRDGDLYADVPFVLKDRMQVIQKQIDRGCGLMTMHFSTFVNDKQGREACSIGSAAISIGRTTTGKRNWYSKISQVETLELASRDHPILRGVPRMLQIRDEVYWKLRFSARRQAAHADLAGSRCRR